MGNHHDRNWAKHPAVKTGAQLSLGDRAADWLRNGMGSWPFIWAFLGLMGAWMLTGGAGIDPMPFILLNLGLSTLAGLQGGILLISAKRLDAINAALAEHDRQLMAEIHRLAKEIHQHTGAGTQ